MQYRSVGRSGLKVSAISLGGWLTSDQEFSNQHFHKMMHMAIEKGVNYIDLADIYAKGHAEELCGQFLREYDRHELVIASKCFWPMSTGVNNRGLSRKHIMESVHATLKRLGTDYLDLFFAHRFDIDTPLDETLRAMEDLIRQGKILYWGTSVWRSEQLREVHRLAKSHHAYAPIVEQPMYNLHERGIELEILPTTQQLGMGLMVWSPLASGVLSGKYLNTNHSLPHDKMRQKWLEPWLSPRLQNQTQSLVDIAKRLDMSPAQLALVWILKNPQITSVITAVTNMEQLEENLSAVHLDISDEVWQELSDLFVGF